jgi:hypothetical protein
VICLIIVTHGQIWWSSLLRPGHLYAPTGNATFTNAVYLVKFSLPSRIHCWWLNVYWRPIIYFMRSRGRRIPRLQGRWLSLRTNRSKVPFVQFSIHEENRSQDTHRHSQGKPGEQRQEKREEVHVLYLLSSWPK